jgi:hypothetical protein
MDASETIRMPRMSFPPPTIASAGPAKGMIVRVAEDAFISESKIQRWVRSGAATRAGTLLATSDGRRYLLRDAVRIIGRRNGDSDPYGLTGRVEALRDFVRQGATVSEGSLRIAHVVYDIEHGAMATPYEQATQVRMEQPGRRRPTSRPPPSRRAAAIR